MDLIQFKKIVFESARQVACDVAQIYEPNVTPNFYTAELECESEKLFLLCTHSDEWAFSKNFDIDGCNLSFVDTRALSEALKSLFQIHPLSWAYLRSGFEKQPHQSLGDIQYWKPQTNGEAIFNWWD